MVRLLSVLCATGLCCVSLSSSLHAQHGDVRYGPWVSLGAGPGLANVSCGGCSDGEKLGFSGFLEIGGTPSERLTVGINGSGWTLVGADTTRSFVSVLALLYFYPSVEQQSFFVKIGGGAARYSESSDVHRLGSNGFAFITGIGYEIPGPGHIHFAPALNFILSPSQSAKRFLAVDERVRVWTASAALAISWRR